MKTDAWYKEHLIGDHENCADTKRSKWVKFFIRCFPPDRVLRRIGKDSIWVWCRRFHNYIRWKLKVMSTFLLGGRMTIGWIEEFVRNGVVVDGMET